MKFNIKINQLTAGKSVMTILSENNIYLDAVCAGNATCGKCKIKLLDGRIAPGSEDKKFFSEEEIAEGWRLACTAYPQEDCVVLFENHSVDSVLQCKRMSLGKSFKNSKKATGICIDIGTTTIAMQLIDIDNKEVLDSFTVLNSQRRFGADVISRIASSNNGSKDALKQCIIEDLKQGMDRWISSAEPKNLPVKIVIAGNTTMIHLLMGYSCEQLGTYPFTPVNIQTINTTYGELFHNNIDDNNQRDKNKNNHQDIIQDNVNNIPITILPAISAFVGGDITAGLLACHFPLKKSTSMLIDLGTNGEMAIGNSEHIVVTSTAAGPAFEGGNITFGTGSIPGAICNVDIQDGAVRLKTIGDSSTTGDSGAIGICGTGVIETVSELVRNGLVDETGLLADEYFESGYPLTDGAAGQRIYFTQKDIRELQMAKSAIRAGIEILIKEYGAAYKDIENVYLAGSFGHEMNIEKAISIGLLPEEFRGKIKAVGNSSMNGAMEYLCEPQAENQTAHIVNVSEEKILSNDEAFNDLYIKYMVLNSDDQKLG